MQNLIGMAVIIAIIIKQNLLIKMVVIVGNRMNHLNSLRKADVVIA